MKSGNVHKVYMYVNNVNGKRYIGVTCRTLCGRAVRGNGYRECPHFWKAIRKYGWESFDVHLMRDYLSKDEADALEKWLIRHFQTTDSRYGYNIQKGGRSAGGLSDEGRQRLIDGQSGANAWNAKPVVIFDLSGKRVARFDTAIDAGKYLNCSSSAFVRACSSEKTTLKNHIVFYEEDIGDIEQLSSNKICRVREATIQSAQKAVCQYSMDGVFIRSYPSMTEACNQTGATIVGICSVVSGDQLSAHGFMWRYDLGNHSDIKRYERTYSNKKLLQIDAKSGNVLREFDSAKDAAKVVPVEYSAICRCAQGRSKTSGGYAWEYSD